MAKDEKPVYRKGRILDTKGTAQRISLGFLREPGGARRLLRKLSWIAPLVALTGAIPYLFRGSEKFYENGSVSRAHAILERNCSNCHTAKFSKVADAACQQCHDGPIHQVNAAGQVRCAECHIEHRGNQVLASVSNSECTRCHSDLTAHGRNVTLRAVQITAFRPGRHAEFAAAGKLDVRPLKLNHAKHMAATADKNRLVAKLLPMTCATCHVTDRSSPKGDLLPVTFQQHCLPCHARELEFDVFQLLGEKSGPAPHTEDPRTIHDAIAKAYQELSNSNPAVMQQPLDRDFQVSPNADAWLATVVKRSEDFLFQKKCSYCHAYEPISGGYPVVQPVKPIQGRFVPGKATGESWMPHAVFQHRAHRAVTCESCHTKARQSTETKDILIPVLSSCLPCHGSTGTAQDNCAQCHLYHDKSRERDRDRRPVEELKIGLQHPAAMDRATLAYGARIARP